MIIDTNTNCSPHVETLRGREVTCIGRYYASSAWKRLTKTEAQLLSDAGFQIFCVFEDRGDPALTRDSGHHDAQIALSQALAIGQPERTAIYFAMEYLPSGYNETHLTGLQEYFLGVRDVIGSQYKVGCYSNGTTLAFLLNHGIIDYAWVSASTSFHGTHDFLKTDKWHIAQRRVDLNWEHVSVDTNDAPKEFGAWSLAKSDPVVATAGEASEFISEHDNQPHALEDPVRTPAEKGEAAPPFWARFGPLAAADKVNQLDEQGSRIAGSINTVKSWFHRLWIGLAGGGAAASQFMDTGQGTTGGAITHLVSAHPYLFAFGSVAVVGGLAYVAVLAIQKGLLSAVKDGRYRPRGA
jgi:hypothetical protein